MSIFRDFVDLGAFKSFYIILCLFFYWWNYMIETWIEYFVRFIFFVCFGFCIFFFIMNEFGIKVKNFVVKEICKLDFFL